MNYRLVVEKGRSKGKVLRLKPNGSVTVGRDQTTTLRVQDAQASRKHFKIDARLGEFVLEDLGSSNGTLLNGKKIGDKVKLAAGDKIQVGETLVYLLEETQSEDGTERERKGELTGREVDGYRIGRLLGRGGMGTVYEAVQLSLERTVAFKVLARELTSDDALIERFVSEARAAGRLSHANIVAVFHVGEAAGVYYYSMEYMANGSVEDLLTRDGKLTVERTIPIIFDAARGLEYAEKQGLIHRDIKPANLMLGQDEVTKICDLGIAAWQSTQPRDACGSPHYVSPEQAQGQPIDHRADLYSLGATWYHMLTGDTVFQGQSAREIVLKHLNEAPPPLVEKDVPADVAAIVHRLLAKDPAQRVQTARQLQADLAELARRHPVRETIMLRIDAVAPEDPPSSELTVTPGMATGVTEVVAGNARTFLWAGVAALAAVAMLGAFVSTVAWQASSQAAVQAATQKELDRVRALLQSGDLEGTKREAQALAGQLAQEGQSEAAEAAQKLGAEAETRRKDGRERAARTRYEAARTALARRSGLPEDDDNALAVLDQIGKGLEQLVLELPDTAVVPEAKALMTEIKGRLDGARLARAERARREEAAREALLRTRKAVDQLLAESRPDRFALAATRVREYAEAHGQSEAKGGDELLADVRRAAEQAVEQQTTLATRLAYERRWSDARAALSSVQAPLGWDDLAAKVTAAAAAVDEGERAATASTRAEREKKAREVLDRAIESTRGDRDARRFAEAASTLRGEGVLVTSTELRRVLDRRVKRLDLAGRALDRLAAHVRGGGRLLKVELTVPGQGSRPSPASEVDASGRRFSFQLQPGVFQDVSIERLTWEQLDAFYRALPPGPALELEVASLAFELERRAEGTERLLALQGRSGSPPEVEELLELATAERP